MDEACADPVAVNSSIVRVTGSRLCIVFSFEQLFLLEGQRQYAIHHYRLTTVASNYAYSFTRITGQHLQRFPSPSLQVVTKSVRTDGASLVNTLRAASCRFIWYWAPGILRNSSIFRRGDDMRAVTFTPLESSPSYSTVVGPGSFPQTGDLAFFHSSPSPKLQ